MDVLDLVYFSLILFWMRYSPFYSSFLSLYFGSD